MLSEISNPHLLSLFAILAVPMNDLTDGKDDLGPTNPPEKEGVHQIARHGRPPQRGSGEADNEPMRPGPVPPHQQVVQNQAKDSAHRSAEPEKLRVSTR